VAGTLKTLALASTNPDATRRSARRTGRVYDADQFRSHWLPDADGSSGLKNSHTVRLRPRDGLIIRMGRSLACDSRVKVGPIGPVLGPAGAHAYDDLASR
jgi:hypothetical protein